ncbi:serine/threonine-protein kinase [Kitasatospora sp. DSM 101779]|uniref:serine/threonine-protein kinase n=1 Tax=Kitasatospora sp. DSM 101779 TaxID=2853165 RepID=UPI0021D99A7D|nr:serine/threonine-protein kinase [Kitasatospora sp. DSM 101779]MCU7827038.1 protein kinase [Kitasatospora sp. DSM 101779]
MWGRGTVLGGRYTLTDRVGVGGMGEVWRADDGVLKRQVAVKIMQPGLLEDRSFTERFRREARILATLRHPGIVHVHDYAEPGGESDQQIAYIVMEFIDGRPLNSVLAAEGPMVPARALGILADALDALHAAHRQDIVHRDLKPSNLMVRSDGGVTVTDFGIAHAMAGTKITTTNSVLGTALYIAPEQADGKPTTPLCDLYSIGVVCFELLTGRLPFTGETVLEIVLKHIQQPPPRLSDEFPRAVRDFVATALAKDPAQRFPDAGAMAAAARAAAARPGAGQAVREPTVFATVPEPVPREAPQAETPRPAPAEPQQRRRSRLIVPIVIPVVISAGVGSVVLVEQAPWQSRAQGAGQQPSVTAPVSPGAAAGSTTGTGAASPLPGSPTGPPTAPGQQTGNPAPDQAGAGGATGGGAAGGAAAGTGTGGGADNTGGAARPPANTPATTAAATTPAQSGPPQGCGGTGWGHITGVGSGQRLGLAAAGLAGGTSAVVGRNTSYGWIRSAPDPGGWYSLYPCNMSKPGLVQNGNRVELSSGFSVTYRWTVSSAPTQGAVYLKDYSSSTCLTDNGAGSAATMQTCTPGNRSQQWFIPPSG